MNEKNQNPESLHEVGKINQQVAKPGFVNEKTPASPLASEADLVSPTIKGGTTKLRSELVRD